LEDVASIYGEVMKPSEKIANLQAARKKHEDLLSLEIGATVVGLFIAGFLFGLSPERVSGNVLALEYTIAVALVIISVFALVSYGQRKYTLGRIQFIIQELIFSEEFHEEEAENNDNRT
jgi:hypothetical protein